MLCDFVHTLWTDRIERHVLAERQVAVVALAGGAKNIIMPSLPDCLADLDAWLIEEPKVVDPDKLELMHALGVA